MIYHFDMIALTIVILLAVLAGSIGSNLREAFSGDWMRFDEPKADMENTEYDYGHNVKYEERGDE